VEDGVEVEAGHLEEVKVEREGIGDQSIIWVDVEGCVRRR